MIEANMLVFILAAVVIIALDLWAIVSVFKSPSSTAAKFLWTLAIAVFPVLGLIAWGIAGPRGVSEAPSSPEHSKG
jgi:hypothetical protein